MTLIKYLSLTNSNFSRKVFFNNLGYIAGLIQRTYITVNALHIAKITSKKVLKLTNRPVKNHKEI